VGGFQRAFDELEGARAELPPPPVGFDRARDILTSQNPLVLDDLPEGEAEQRMQKSEPP